MMTGWKPIPQSKREGPVVLEGIFRRRKLPHWDVDDGTYFVTACLEGSIPARGLRDLRRYRAELDCRAKPEKLSADEWELEKHKLIFARFDKIIDHAPTVRHLANGRVADEIRKSIYYFAEMRYDLLAYVVMPSHFHWVFHPRREWYEQACGAGFQPVGPADAGGEDRLEAYPTEAYPTEAYPRLYFTGTSRNSIGAPQHPHFVFS
jgi:hypothetical protein